MKNIKVAISSDFLTAFANLPRQVQGKVTEFVNKFRNNPTAHGINYEKIKTGIDKKIYSVRIDNTYRGIVACQQETGVYLLLWVDHHDEAYQWAARKRCEVNPKTGTIQVFDVQNIAEAENINIDAQTALSIAMVQRAMLGDVQAATFIRDTIGEKPTDKVEVDQSLTIEEWAKNHRPKL